MTLSQFDLSRYRSACDSTCYFYNVSTVSVRARASLHLHALVCARARGPQKSVLKLSDGYLDILKGIAEGCMEPIYSMCVCWRSN